MFSLLVTKRTNTLLKRKKSVDIVLEEKGKKTALSQGSCYIPGQLRKHDFG